MDAIWWWAKYAPDGDFAGGDLCFPTLGIKVAAPSGSLIYLRSHILPHFIDEYTGFRLCHVAFMQQVVVEYYKQEANRDPFQGYPMPPWYKNCHFSSIVDPNWKVEARNLLKEEAKQAPLPKVVGKKRMHRGKKDSQKKMQKVK